MAVGDFVHGKGTQQEIPQRNEQQTTRASRLRAAELARVEVPRTTLSGFATGNQRSAGLPLHQREISGYGYEQSVQGQARDMFDTDLEGIDDSTTVTSLSFSKNGDVQQGYGEAQRQRERGPFTHLRQPSAFVAVNEQQGGNENAYKSVAERMREFDSDPADYEDYQMHQAAERHAYAEGNGYGNEQMNGWDAGQPSNEEPMSWQKIEQALHQNHHQRQPTTESIPADMDYGMRDAYIEGQATYDRGEEDNDGYHSSPQTPKASQKTPGKGRVSVRSRFMTPNFQNDRRSGQFGAGPVTSQSFIPRPSSAPGNPFSPDSNPRRTLSKRNTPAPIPHSPPPKDPISHTKYPQRGGIFDTTDLSALDSSDSTDVQETFTSPALSTLSPVSSKRPLSSTVTTPVITDYPPNILRAKKFSDLQAESFDYNPAPPQPIFPPQDPALPLPERLMRLKSLTDDQRRAFFSGLSMAEWEESGDWLIEQFSVILQKTKDARVERRKVASVFEAEIKRRYELTEGEGVEIRRRLDDMRSGGMGVLKRQNSV